MSAASRAAALGAAAALLDEGGYAGFTVDEVASRSGVGKATIYRHWRNGFDLATDAWGRTVTEAVPVLATGDAVADLTGQVERLAAFYASPRGRVAAQLLGAGISVAGGTDMLRERFFRERRAATEHLIEAGQRAGQLPGDLSPALLVDALFGPIVFRLFNGLEPITASQARAVSALVLGGSPTS